MLFAGHTFGQSKKSKKNQTQFIPPQIKADQVVEEAPIMMREISNACAECAEKLTPSYLLIKDSRKYGYVNDHGNLVIPRIYDKGDYFSEGFAIVSIGNYSGTIDKHGSFIIPLKYASLSQYKKKNFIASINGSYGIIDTEGKEVLPFIYDYISERDEYLILKYKGKKGIYDFEQRKWVIPAKYNDVYDYSTGYFMGKKENGNIDWYDRATFTIIDSTYSEVENISQGFFLVTKNNLKGIVDSKNNIVVPVVYQEFRSSYYSSSGFAVAKKNDKYGIITYDNRVLVDFIYDKITTQTDLFVVQKNNLFGIVDRLTFKETTPCIYQDIQVYNNQRIFAKKNDLYGIIKYDGTIVEGFIYDFRKTDSNQSIYKKGNKYGLIDYNYNFITDAIYDEIKFIRDGYYNSYYLTFKGKEKILLDSKGQFLVDVSAYDDAMPTKERGVIVTKNKKYGMIEKKSGNVIVPLQYDLIVYDYKDTCIVFDKGLYYEMTFDEENKPVLSQIK